MPQTATKSDKDTKRSFKAKTKTKSPFESASTNTGANGLTKQQQKQLKEDGDVDVDMEDGTSPDENDEEEEEEEEEEPEKDEAERKLEKILFGDDEGFRGALRDQRDREVEELLVHGGSDGDEDVAGDGDGDGESEGGDRDREDLDDVPDADLFFLDSGAAPVETDIVDTTTKEDGIEKQKQQEEEEEATAQPAWYDSDDDRLAVSLASQPKLRKLRVTEAEDLVSGREYIKRLRRQFQRLHPVPEWADPELLAKQRKKRAAALAEDSDADADAVSGVDGMDTDDETEETMSLQPLARLLQNTTGLTKLEDTRSGGKRKLRPEVLDIQRLKDVGGNQPSSIDSLTFHPHYPLILSSGPASTLFLHHISPQAPTPNPLLTSLHIRHTPIHTSTITPPTGNNILISGRRRYFHIWHLHTGKIDKINTTADRREEQRSMERLKPSPCGRFIGLVGTPRKGGGLINILDAGTAQWVAQVRVDGRGGVADFAWWGDGEGLTVVAKNGEVSEWDGRVRRVVARWVDEGAVGTTVLALGGRSGRDGHLGGDRWVAVGSSSGVVNVYDRREWVPKGASMSTSTNNASDQHQLQLAETGIPRAPKPTRALDQLTTPISHLVFAPDGQMLVMASRWKRDALRLVHLPTCTVYRNWPTSNTPLGRISSVAISPNSGLLAVANEQGRIRLWEIHG